MPDRDQFVGATRAGAAALHALSSWLDGAAADAPHEVAVYLRGILREAGDLPYVVPFEEMMDSFAGSPLEARNTAFDQIEAFFRGVRRNGLDMAIERAVLAAAADQNYDARAVLTSALVAVAERHLIDARGGLVREVGSDRVIGSREKIRACIEPAAHYRASRLLHRKPRPGAPSGRHAKKPDPRTANLLGGW